VANAGPARLASRFLGQITQQRGQANAARPGFYFQFVTHVFVQPNGNGNAHGIPV
jgi:hypothetical protein